MNLVLPEIVGFLFLLIPIFPFGCWFAPLDLSISTKVRPGSQAHFIIIGHFAHFISNNFFFGYICVLSICVLTIFRCYYFHFYLISDLDFSIAYIYHFWLWITVAEIVFPGIVFSNPVYFSSRFLYQPEIIWFYPSFILSTFHSSPWDYPWAPIYSDPFYSTIFSCLNVNAFWTADFGHVARSVALGLWWRRFIGQPYFVIVVSGPLICDLWIWCFKP